MQDLENILACSLKKFLKMQRDVYQHFNLILILPDQFVKHHVRYVLDMLFINMGFKSIFIH